MEDVNIKQAVAIDEQVKDLLLPMCTKAMFGITCMIGLWGLVCIVSGMVSVGGPVALVSSFLAAF